MAYDDATKEQAYEAFREARTVEGAAALMNIPGPTVYRWSIKYRWKERLVQDLEKIAEDPFNKGVTITKKFEISEQDQQTLRNATVIEGVCLACIQGKRIEDPEHPGVKVYENPLIENLGLKPRSFVEATNTLEKCWKARNAIFARNLAKAGGVIDIDGEDKEDYVADIKRLSQKMEG